MLARSFPIMLLLLCSTVVSIRLEAVVIIEWRLWIVITLIVVRKWVLGITTVVIVSATAATPTPLTVLIVIVATIGRLLLESRSLEEARWILQHTDVEIRRIVGSTGPGRGSLQKAGLRREIWSDAWLRGLQEDVGVGNVGPGGWLAACHLRRWGGVWRRTGRYRRYDHRLTHTTPSCHNGLKKKVANYSHLSV